MRNKFLPIFFLISLVKVFYTFPIYAQESKSSLLWQITKEGIRDTSFLFGTIHIIPEAYFFIPEGLERAFDKSEEIYFEINMASQMDLTSQMAILPKLMMKEGITLRDLYSESEFDEISAFFEKKGLPLFLFQAMKPMFVQMMVQFDFDALLQGGDNGMVSYEMYLMDKARDVSKPSGGLETIDFQISIFDSIPYGVQAKMLLESVRADSELNEEDSSMKELFELYRRQDLEELQLMMNNSDDPVTKEFGDLFLFKRNRNWIPVIEELIKEKAVFIAVGAAHLPGEQGIITLLRNQGYQVEPLHH